MAADLGAERGERGDVALAEAQVPKCEMSGRERLLTVLHGGIPDRLPFVPLVNEFFWSTLSVDWKVNDPVDCCRCIGSDIAERWVRSYVGYGLHFDDQSADHGVPSDIRRIARVGDQTILQYETPLGTLTQRLRETSEGGKTWFREERLVKTIDDLRAYQYLWECMEPRPAYHFTQHRMDTIGDDGIIMLLTPCTPLLHLIMYDLGLARTSYFLADYPKAMERLMSTMADKALMATRVAAGSPAEVGIVPENSGTLLVSPSQFARYCAPILAEMAHMFHENGKLLLLHACGHLHDLLPLIAGTGLDGVESLTPPPTGNVDLGYARQVLGPHKTIIGGLDPVWFAQATPQEVEIRVTEIAAEVAPGRHFMLMPSDSTPAGTPLANFLAVQRAIDRMAG